MSGGSPSAHMYGNNQSGTGHRASPACSNFTKKKTGVPRERRPIGKTDCLSCGPLVFSGARPSLAKHKKIPLAGPVVFNTHRLKAEFT